jgi:predicted porin
MIRKTPLALAALATLTGGLAVAQTPPASTALTLYGAIDMAAVWVDNAQGRSLVRLDTAGNWASRWGMRGSEDLGGGLQAVFTLESGFNADDGTMGQGGLLFGRQAFVGLRHVAYGTFTMGRQYDFVYAIPPDIVMVIGGLAGAVGGAGTSVDMHLGGTRYDNTIKWTGNFGPVYAGLMRGQGNETGGQKMHSAMLGYRDGAINAGMAWVRDNFSPATGGNEALVASLHYDISPTWKIISLAGESRARTAQDSQSRNLQLQGGAIQRFTPALSVGYVLGQSNVRNAAGATGRIREYGVGAYYDFSKRTTVYGIGTSVHSHGSAGNAYSSIPGVGASPVNGRSDDSAQLVLKVGIRHFF